MGRLLVHKAATKQHDVSDPCPPLMAFWIVSVVWFCFACLVGFVVVLQWLFDWSGWFRFVLVVGLRVWFGLVGLLVCHFSCWAMSPPCQATCQQSVLLENPPNAVHIFLLA